VYVKKARDEDLTDLIVHYVSNGQLEVPFDFLQSFLLSLIIDPMDSLYYKLLKSSKQGHESPR
jgi:hypothetical protein